MYTPCVQSPPQSTRTLAYVRSAASPLISFTGGLRPASQPLPTTTPMMASAAVPAATGGLKEDIAGLYDESSGVWERICGEHLHHGFYEPAGDATPVRPDVRRAQIRTIDEALAFAAVQGASTVHTGKSSTRLVETTT